MSASDQPKHRDISQKLREEIALGRYASAERLPSESQLVKRFSVSRPTVVRALQDLERAGVIERRAGSGTYLKKASLSQTPEGKRLFGLMMPGLDTLEIFAPICGEIASLARGSDFGVLWGGPSDSPRSLDAIQQAGHLCEQFISAQVRGVFFAPFELTARKEEVNRHLIDRLQSAGIPIVLIDRDVLPFPGRTDLDLVSIDNVAGGYLLAEHLIKLGCKRVCFLVLPLSAATVDARIAGAREAFVRRKIELRPNWLAIGDPGDIKFTRGLVAGKQWDAFICANDYTAALLLRSLEQLKIRVPDEVRVVGFDDVKYATLLGVPLTTIHQPCREIALAAFRAMLERTTDPTLPGRSILLAPRLVVRESCGAYLPHAAT